MIFTTYELTRLSISSSHLVRSKDCKPLPSLGLQLLADYTVSRRMGSGFSTHTRWAYTQLGKTLKFFSVFVVVPDSHIDDFASGNATLTAADLVR